MKYSIIDRPTICFDHQSAYCWSKFVCDVDPGWPKPSAKCTGSVRAILQDLATATLSRIICWRGVARWIEKDGGPINYWKLHSLWCLLKEKHGVTCNKWCNKWKHAWFPCYSCRSGHKSQKCEIFVHTFCHKMHNFTKTMPSIGRHIPLILCVRKFPIHYRLNDQNR